MRSLLGKVVVVTGAAMGIGRALASRAISEGARGVVVADISAELERTADELRRGAAVTNRYLFIFLTAQTDPGSTGVSPLYARKYFFKEEYSWEEYY